MNALRLGAARGQEQHVAGAQQTLGPGRVQDRPRVDPRGYLKGHRGREIGLDQAGNHIDRGRWSGQDEVNARGPTHLGQTGNRLLYLTANGQHEVGQLIDNHDQIGQTLVDHGVVVWLGGWRRSGRGVQARPGGVFVKLVLNHLGQLDDAVRTRRAVLQAAIIGADIPRPLVPQQFVAILHPPHNFLQGCAGFLGVGNHVRQLVGQVFIQRQLQHFGVNHDEAHVAWGWPDTAGS